tara:strand:+ start:683 stop:898 length:216 start_codon:yes stop_codon:yes gene_type:complete
MLHQSSDKDGNIGIFCHQHMMIGRETIKRMGFEITKKGCSASTEDDSDLEEIKKPHIIKKTKSIQKQKVSF